MSEEELEMFVTGYLDRHSEYPENRKTNETEKREA